MSKTSITWQVPISSESQKTVDEFQKVAAVDLSSFCCSVILGHLETWECENILSVMKDLREELPNDGVISLQIHERLQESFKRCADLVKCPVEVLLGFHLKEGLELLAHDLQSSREAVCGGEVDEFQFRDLSHSIERYFLLRYNLAHGLNVGRA